MLGRTGDAVVGDVGEGPAPPLPGLVAATRGRAGAVGERPEVEGEEGVCTRRRFGGGMVGWWKLCGLEKR
jgi:hypothetical protein